ncbi:sulfur carrier protein ThiS [bacterium]|jgi:thiamine biosynthesis protein ThiS|nr:sulfur carrier protein ThiS [bacterium]MBT3795884.1 sulfur carrier protein ThiS [bacterium]
MIVFINGDKTKLNRSISLEKFLEEHFSNLSSSYAVAFNNKFVPKSSYRDIVINDGDEIEVVSAQPGG